MRFGVLEARVWPAAGAPRIERRRTVLALLGLGETDAQTERSTVQLGSKTLYGVRLPKAFGDAVHDVHAAALAINFDAARLRDAAASYVREVRAYAQSAGHSFNEAELVGMVNAVIAAHRRRDHNAQRAAVHALLHAIGRRSTASAESAERRDAMAVKMGAARYVRRTVRRGGITHFGALVATSVHVRSALAEAARQLIDAVQAEAFDPAEVYDALSVYMEEAKLNREARREIAIEAAHYGADLGGKQIESERLLKLVDGQAGHEPAGSGDEDRQIANPAVHDADAERRRVMAQRMGTASAKAAALTIGRDRSSFTYRQAHSSRR